MATAPETSSLLSEAEAADRRIPPIRRNLVGVVRLRIRDAWNLRELRVADLFRRHASSDPSALGSLEFAAFFEDFVGDAAIAEEDGHWVFHLAGRGGSSASLDAAYFGVRAWGGYRSLREQPDALRNLAELERLAEPSRELLLELMTVLNGELPVPDVEVDMVLDDARHNAASAGSTSRADVIRAIGVWYTHVARRRTPLRDLVGSSLKSVFPEREHHAEVLGHLSKSGPVLYRDLLAVRGAGGLLRPSDEGAGSMPAARGVARVAHLLVAIAVHLAFLVALLFPTGFSLLLIYVGCVHGRDQCPRDLDGLFVWYGALCMASMVVDCSGTSSGVSAVSWLLRIVMLLLPWQGLWWTLQLSSKDWAVCGPYLTRASQWLWATVVVVELYMLAVVLYVAFRNIRKEQALNAASAVSGP